MGSYQRSLLAILLAQFTRKRFAGGMAGVVRLASRSITVQVSLLQLTRHDAVHQKSFLGS